MKRISSYLAIIVMLIAARGVGKAQLVSDDITETAEFVFTCNSLTPPEFDYQWDSKKSDKKKRSDQDVWKEELDTDGDGVPDNEDLCPYVAGSKNARGCPDKDGDGVPDFMDDCPDVAGLPEFNGCPDSDGDGIPDYKDECPFEKGPASRKGCPVEPKTNSNPGNNGQINQNSNNEPIAEVKVINIPRRNIYQQQQNAVQPQSGTQQGVVKDHNYYIELARNLELEQNMINNANRQNSEPIISSEPMQVADTRPTDNNPILSDKDNDGVPDIEDKCPNEPGPKSNAGCPVLPSSTIQKTWKVTGHDIILSSDEMKLLDEVLNNLKFSHGRSILSDNSYNSLDQFADLLNKKYSWTIVLHCYTNEAGNTYRNQQLSVNRGDHIRTYLSSKGINHSRMQVKGHGDSSSTLSTNRIEVEITR